MKIINRIDIESTPERVFYWLESPERAMEWMTCVSKTEIIKETPNRIGSTSRELIEEKGRGTVMYGIVMDFIPNKRLVFHLEGDFNSADVVFTLEQEAGMTKLTQHSEIQFKGNWKMLSIILRPLLKRKILIQSKKEFFILKNLCETRNSR